MNQLALSLLLLVFASGCVGPVKSIYPPAPGAPARTVHVVNQGGIHTGIVLAVAEVPAELWVAKGDYPGARYLEVGWGDHDGYRKPLTFWIVCKGLFWPTRSVLKLEGFNQSFDERFVKPETTILEVNLSAEGFRRLCKYIEEAHEVDALGKPRALGGGWYGARGKFCFLRTCNNWVARGLRQAGCPITPFYCLTRGPVLFQTRKFGQVLREPAGARASR